MSSLLWSLLFILWAFPTAVLLIETLLTLFALARDSKMGENTDYKPISILKPLRGLDSGIADNLESFFTQDYPKYELFLSVADPKDPVCEVIREKIAQHPEINAQLIIGAIDIGPNPKVNNLIKSYEGAHYDWMIVSDSNIRVGPDYLKRMASHFGDDVGIMSSIIAGFAPQGWGGLLEATFLNTFFIRSIYIALASGTPCVQGKSMMFRRATLERLGGLRTLGVHLAEDYVAGKKVKEMGLKVVIVGDPVGQYIGQYSFRDFWKRHVRWGRMRKSLVLSAFFLELSFGAFVSGLLGLIWFCYATHLPPVLFILFHLLVWMGCDLTIMHRVGQPVTFDKSAASWLTVQVCHAILWFHVMSGNTVDWRGQKLKLKRGGTLQF